MILHCSTCKVDYPVCSEEPDSELMDINTALIAGILSVGLNLHQLNEICSTLLIPTISAKNFDMYLNQVYTIFESYKENVNISTEETICQASVPTLKNDYETKKQKFLENLKLTTDEIEKMSLLTVNQKNDCLWHKERKKRLTASNFGRIYKLLESTDKNKVAKDILFSSFTGNVYTKYGIDNEQTAIRDFEIVLKKSVTACGLFVDENYPFLAASPDGLIGDNAILEIKCPYKAQNMKPEDAISKNLIKFATFIDGHFQLKRTDKYYYQVQGQLYVTGKKVCYFTVWTQLGIVYEIIEPDEECWKKLFPKLENFYFEYLLPVILES